MNDINMEIEDGVAWITFDDGKVNALNTEALIAIRSCCNEAAAASACIVLQGRPGIFSAGFDLKELRGEQAQQVEVLAAGIDLMLTFLKHPYPILSLCTGHAYPMGAFLLLSSDYRIGVEGKWNIGLNEVAIGMTVPPFALAIANHRLTRPGLARVATAGMMNPTDARSYGYLDDLVAPGQLQASATKVLGDFSKLDMPSYAATKAAMNASVIEEVEQSKSMLS